MSIDRPLTLMLLLLLAAAIWFETVGTVEVAKIGSFTLHEIDIPIVIMVPTVLFLLIARRFRALGPVIAGMILAFVMLVALLRGLAGAPFIESVPWLRNHAVTICLIFLALVARANKATERTITAYMVVAACVLTTLLVLRMIFGTDLFSIRPPGELVVVNEGRPISVRATMIMAMTVAMLVSDGMRNRWRVGRTRIVLLAILLGAVLVSAQGTATIAMLAGIVVLMLLENGPTIAGRATVIGFAALGLVAVALIPYDRFVTSDVEQTLAARVRNKEYREFIWKGFMAHYQELSGIDKAIGPPAHKVPAFVIHPPGGLQLWSLSLHSMYYGELALFGAIGLGLYAILVLWIGGALLTMVARRVPLDFFSPALGAALLVQALLLGYSYEVRNEEFLLVAIPIIIAAAGISLRPGRLSIPKLSVVDERMRKLG